MKFLARLIFYFVSNLIGLLIIAFFVPGFKIPADYINLATAGAVLMIINIFIRPILKFVLKPLIWLTLGLFIIVINASILFLLDFLLESISIIGIMPLFYAAVIIGLINTLIGLLEKIFFRH